MSDANTEPPDAERRPFESYTSTDHARVALSYELFSLAGTCHQALIPEKAAGDGWPDAGIKVAQSVMSAARDIMDAAVVAAYESGLTWEQIGRAFTTGQGDDGITRQSAWTKYAPAVGQFHEQLADAIDRAERGEDPVDYSRGPWPKRICNTESYAPRLENVTSTVEYPGTLGPVRKPGEFTAALSDPATACSAQIAGSAGPTRARSGAGMPRSSMILTGTTACTAGLPAPVTKDTGASTISRSGPRDNANRYMRYAS